MKGPGHSYVGEMARQLHQEEERWNNMQTRLLSIGGVQLPGHQTQYYFHRCKQGNRWQWVNMPSVLFVF